MESGFDAVVAPAGDTLQHRGYTLMIPSGAIDAAAGVRLSSISRRRARGLTYERIDPEPLSIEISGARVIDTLHVLVPTLDVDADHSVVCAKVGGSWKPLRRTVVDDEHRRVDLAPETLGGGAESEDHYRTDLFQVEYEAIATNLRRLSLPRVGSVVLLIHGLGRRPGVWSTALVDSLHAGVGEVWVLDYDWKRGILAVAAEASARMESEFAARPVLILAHSTGGLVARAVVRAMGERDLDVRKVVFLGTPHFGLSAETIEQSSHGVFSSDVVLDPFAWEGVRDIEENSAVVAGLAQPLILDRPPEYMCVVGACLPQRALECEQSDGVVCRESADLSGGQSDGSHESAKVMRTKFVTESCDHAGLADYALRGWPSIRGFFGADPVAYELYVAGRPSGSFWNYGDMRVFRDKVLQRSWPHRLPGELALVVVDESVRTTTNSTLYGLIGGSYYTLHGDTLSHTYPPARDIYDATTDGRYIYGWQWQGYSLVRFDLDWTNPDTLFALNGDFYRRYMGITYDPDTRSVWISPYTPGWAMRNFTLDGRLLHLVQFGGYNGAGLAMDYADRTLWMYDLDDDVYVHFTREGKVIETWKGPNLTTIYGAEFYPAFE